MTLPHLFRLQCPPGRVNILLAWRFRWLLADASPGVSAYGPATLLALLALAASVAACSDTYEQRAGPIPVDAQDRISRNYFPALKGTIGEFCTLGDSAPIVVEGYGIVAGLPNTGSGDMDPRIREL